MMTRWSGFLLKVAVIFLACFWIYSPVFHGEWLWDDDYLLTNNAVVQSPDGLGSLWFAPATADYLPMTMSALWLARRALLLAPTDAGRPRRTTTPATAQSVAAREPQARRASYGAAAAAPGGAAAPPS
jgi:hypothetical protein